MFPTADYPDLVKPKHLPLSIRQGATMTRIHRAASFAARSNADFFRRVCACARHQSVSNIDATGRKFMMQAAEGGMAEVEPGWLATQKTSSEDEMKTLPGLQPHGLGPPQLRFFPVS